MATGLKNYADLLRKMNREAEAVKIQARATAIRAQSVPRKIRPKEQSLKPQAWANHAQLGGGMHKKASGRILEGRTWDEIPHQMPPYGEMPLYGESELSTLKLP